MTRHAIVVLGLLMAAALPPADAMAQQGVYAEDDVVVYGGDAGLGTFLMVAGALGTVAAGATLMVNGGAATRFALDGVYQEVPFLMVVQGVALVASLVVGVGAAALLALGGHLQRDTCPESGG